MGQHFSKKVSIQVSIFAQNADLLPLRSAIAQKAPTVRSGLSNYAAMPVPNRRPNRSINTALLPLVLIP